MIPRVAATLVALGTLFATSYAAGVAADGQKQERPKAALRANPGMIFPPARVVATVELTKGSDDYQDYYCPKIEWEWGDGTQSESSVDCDPYEPGKSEIRRRYSEDHNYRVDYTGASSYNIIFRMKQGTKVVLTLKQTIRVSGADGR